MNPSAGTELKTAFKRIRLRAQHPKIAKKIEEDFSLSQVSSAVLAARGFKPTDELKHYIRPTLKEGLPDPFKLKNIDKAVEIIGQTIKQGAPIAICSDFDVDGLSGGAQAVHFLRSVGAKVTPYVPDRFKDGYGLNERIINAAHKDGCALVIAIDYGTTNIKEIELARSLGMKSIVVDHHHVGADHSRPDAFVNPQQPGCGFANGILSAAGIVWFLLWALKVSIPEAKDVEVKNYLDLACLGTICDMVPLIGANRVIAKRGLELLTDTKRVGLVSLKDAAGIRSTVNCHDVGFAIGPRLNAAGRMVHGEVVIELLTTDDTDRASRLAGKLNRLNTDRQETESIVKEKAIKSLMNSKTLPWGVVVWDENFHTGVVGIVAQRLVEQFYRPSVVLGIDSDGIWKGSVRGIRGFSVIKTLEAVSKYLVKYGGHEGAGGLSVKAENLEGFVAAFNDECRKRLSDLEIDPFVDADTEVTFEDLSLDLVRELSGFSPFGTGNPVPVLLTRGVKVMEVKDIKGSHLKVTFQDGKRYLTGMLWRQSKHPDLIAGKFIDLAYRIDKSTFNGYTELQANIQAVEASKL